MPRGKKGKKKQELLDEIDPKELNEKELIQYCLTLLPAIQQERFEQEHFRLEMEKIKAYWAIAREQLADLSKQKYEKLTEIDNVAEIEHISLTDRARGLQNLQYLSGLKVKQAYANGVMESLLTRKPFCSMELELLKDRTYVKMQLRDQIELHEMQLKQERMRHYQECTYERLRAENEGRDFRMISAESLKRTRNETLQLCHKSMMTVEKLKASQVENVIDQNAKAFNHMKDYYNDIIFSNMAVLSAIDKELKLLLKIDNQETGRLRLLTAENKGLREPLAKATAQVKELQNALKSFNTDRRELATEMERCRMNEKEVGALKWELQVLVLQNEGLAAEREKVKRKFERTLMDIQRNATRENFMLAEKLAFMEKEAEKRDAMLKVQNKATSMWQPHDCEKFRSELQSLLDAKEQELKDWEERAARYLKFHDNLLHTGQNIMEANKIPADEVEILRAQNEIFELCKACEADSLMSLSESSSNRRT